VLLFLSLTITPATFLPWERKGGTKRGEGKKAVSNPLFGNHLLYEGEKVKDGRGEGKKKKKKRREKELVDVLTFSLTNNSCQKGEILGGKGERGGKRRTISKSQIYRGLRFAACWEGEKKKREGGRLGRGGGRGRSLAIQTKYFPYVIEGRRGGEVEGKKKRKKGKGALLSRRSLLPPRLGKEGKI